MTVSRFIRGLRWSGAASVGPALLGLLQLALLVRWLDKADFATFALAAVWFNLGAHLQEGGLNAAMIREQRNDAAQLSTLLWLNLLLGIVLLGVSYPVAQLAASFYALPQLHTTLLYVSLLFPINALRSQYKALLQKDLRFRTLTLIELTAALISMSAAVGLAYAGWGVYALVTGMGLRLLVEALPAIVAGRSYFILRWRITLPSVKPHLLLARDHWMERFLTHIVYQLDILLIGKWLGADALGIYEVFKRLLVRPANMLAGAVERVTFPIMARLADSPEHLSRFYHRTVQTIMSVDILLYVPLLLFAPWIVPVYFGPEWAVYTDVFQWMIALTLLLAVTQLTDSFLLVRGRISRWSWAGLVLAILWAVAIISGSMEGLRRVIQAMTIAQLLFTLLIVPRLIRMEGDDRSAYYAWSYPLLVAAGTAIPAAYLSSPVAAVMLFLACYLGWQYFYNRRTVEFLRQLLVSKYDAP